MEKTRRDLWLMDALPVAVYLVLVAFTAPYLRQFRESWNSLYPVYDPWGRLIAPAGTPHVDAVYHAGAWQQALPALCIMVLLPLVRRRPLAFAGAVAIAQVYVASMHPPGNALYSMLIAADISLVTISLSWRRRTSIKAAGLILLGGVFSFSAFPPGASDLMPTHLVVITLLTTVAWLLGSSTRERRAGAVRQRADAAAQAVANERLRIARELHDMIAHSIGIIAIQAGMGNRVIDTQPAEARNALRAIEETSRDTLSQLRRTLTALRHGEDAQTPTDPAPGLADLDKLVASTKHAGVLAIVETVGIPLPLPGEVDLAAYRIVQESVTNVVRHSGARTCRVRIEYRDTSVAITVSDEGHGVLGSGGTGFGLVGMRERVSLVHGTFRAGPRFGGGFLVSATLPMPGFETTFGSTKAHPDSKAADVADRDHRADSADSADSADTDGREPDLETPPHAHPAPVPNPAVTP